jgi:rfaE bifunctional protein nucleotidyltransferase chain/domain
MHKAYLESKIFSDAGAAKFLLARWRLKRRKIVFTNGCFDLLHAGHVDFLQKASELGDVLAVGLNDDGSVARLKGAGRPVNPQAARAQVLASLEMVDAVILFPEDTPVELIRFVQPDVLVKGADYTPESIAGYDIVKAKGGEVVTIGLLEGFSTSGLIARLRAAEG